MARAVAEVAYQRGAKFVDLNVFDYYLKRARAVHSDPELLEYVPPWYGERLLSVGDHRCALVYLAGPAPPDIMDGVSPELVGKDTPPHIRESSQVVNERTTNWTTVPCPTAGMGRAGVPPARASPAALQRLWEEIGYVCRLDVDDPIAAWTQAARQNPEAVARQAPRSLRPRLAAFPRPRARISALGCLPVASGGAPGSRPSTGSPHAPNLPTEEVFTTPDPARVEGVVTSTKPLFQSPGP